MKEPKYKKMYKDAPTVETDESGKKYVKKGPTDEEKKALSGKEDDSMPQGEMYDRHMNEITDMQDRHLAERKDMVKRHMKEMKKMAPAEREGEPDGAELATDKGDK